MSRASRAHQRLAVRYFDDRILLTDTSAWAYFRLPTVSYEFVTPEEREALATNVTIALAAIRMPDAEVHLRVAHRAYPAAEWAMTLNGTSDEGPGWRDYLEEMYRHVWTKDFWSKEVYLGVRLGPRGRQIGGGVLSQLFGFYQRTEHALGIDDDHVPDGEISRWTEHAERLGRALASSALYARHATSVEVAWLFQHA
ncbi:MAG: ATPase, partial [Nonomuraea muscovyensis]|nr:ATPase [Nonomuraea muscovyensis]